MWILSQIPLIATISYIVLGLYVWTRNPGAWLNRSCALFIACLALWSLEKYPYHAGHDRRPGPDVE